MVSVGSLDGRRRDLAFTSPAPPATVAPGNPPAVSPQLSDGPSCPATHPMPFLPMSPVRCTLRSAPPLPHALGRLTCLLVTRSHGLRSCSLLIPPYLCDHWSALCRPRCNCDCRGMLLFRPLYVAVHPFESLQACRSVRSILLSTKPSATPYRAGRYFASNQVVGFFVTCPRPYPSRGRPLLSGSLFRMPWRLRYPPTLLLPAPRLYLTLRNLQRKRLVFRFP